MRPFIYFLLFFSTYLIAKSIAETKDNISPLLVGQSAPKATITTLNGDQLEFDAFLNEKKPSYFFIAVVGALFVIHKWDNLKS